VSPSWYWPSSAPTVSSKVTTCSSQDWVSDLWANNTPYLKLDKETVLENRAKKNEGNYEEEKV